MTPVIVCLMRNNRRPHRNQRGVKASGESSTLAGQSQSKEGGTDEQMITVAEIAELRKCAETIIGIADSFTQMFSGNDKPIRRSCTGTRLPWKRSERS